MMRSQRGRQAPRAPGRAAVALLAGAMAIAGATSARAEDDAEARQRARAVAASGIEAYEAGRHEEAIARLREADAIFDAPHHDVYVARALKQLGRWLEARDAYRAAIGAREDRPGFADARRLAQEESDLLESALPALEIAVRDGVVARILVDGRPATPSAAGKVDVDPGPHRVRVETTDGRADEKSVRLGEGVLLRVTFEPVATAGSPDADQDAAGGGAGGGRSWLAPTVAFGIGGAGLVVGAITGIASLSAVGDLEKSCPATTCAPAQQGDIDSANTLANVSNVGFVVGAVGVAVGVVLLVVTGDDDEAAAALAPRRGGAALRGSF